VAQKSLFANMCLCWQMYMSTNHKQSAMYLISMYTTCQLLGQSLKRGTTSTLYRPLRLTCINAVHAAGVSLPVFKTSMASKSVAAVAAASGLPAANITAAYTAAKPTGRRMLSTAESNSSSSRVAATYSLTAAKPALVAQQIVTAVDDGSLQQELEARLDLPSSPVVSLSAAASRSGAEPQVILKPASLDSAATAAASAATAAASAAAAAADVVAVVAAAVTGSVEAVAAAKDAAAAASSQASSSSSSSTGAIVGGVVGGVCGAAVLAGVAWWCTVGAKKRQQQQQSGLPKDVLAPSTSGSSWNGDDESSVISGSTSTGNLRSVDVVMHVIEEDASAAAAKGGKQ
jgi:hypothetical protein